MFRSLTVPEDVLEINIENFYFVSKKEKVLNLGHWPKRGGGCQLCQINSKYHEISM